MADDTNTEIQEDPYAVTVHENDRQKGASLQELNALQIAHDAKRKDQVETLVKSVTSGIRTAFKPQNVGKARF